MDSIAKIRNPIIVALIPLIGLAIVLGVKFSTTIQTYPQLVLFGFVLQGYILYWISVSSTQLKKFNPDINEQMPVMVFVLFLIGILLSVILGSYLYTWTDSRLMFYLPAYLLTIALGIWLIIGLYKIAEGCSVMSKRQSNPLLNFILLVLLPPIGMAYTQRYLNQMINGEISTETPKEESS